MLRKIKFSYLPLRQNGNNQIFIARFPAEKVCIITLVTTLIPSCHNLYTVLTFNNNLKVFCPPQQQILTQ